MANENVLKNEEKKEEVVLPKTLDEMFIDEYFRLKNELVKANEEIARLARVIQAIPGANLKVEDGVAKLAFDTVQSKVEDLYKESPTTTRFLTITDFYGLTEKLVDAVKQQVEEKA